MSFHMPFLGGGGGGGKGKGNNIAYQMNGMNDNALLDQYLRYIHNRNKSTDTVFS